MKSKKCYNSPMIIYTATAPNGKIYVGQTVRPLATRRAHHARAKVKTPIANAIKKYGRRMEWAIIDTADSLAALNAKEEFWIKELNTLHPHGYNLTAGGKNAKHTAASRAVMSAVAKGKPKSAAHKAALSAAAKGKPKSDSHKAAMSAARTGKKRAAFTPEHRANMSASRLGVKRGRYKKAADSERAEL